MTWGDDGFSDDESGGEQEEDGLRGIDREDVEPQNETNAPSDEGTSNNSVRGRVKRTPTWMRDYESGEGLSDGESDAETAYMVTGDVDPYVL